MTWMGIAKLFAAPHAHVLRCAMSILSLYVVNKSGGLVFSKDLTDKVARVDLNDSLRLASIWWVSRLQTTRSSPFPQPYYQPPFQEAG